MMSQKAILFLIFFTIIPLTAFQQFNSKYFGLQSQGTIPADFMISSEEKFKSALEIDENEIGRDFFLNSRFAIDEILNSGRIVFNDPISLYVKEIAEILLSNNPELFETLRFYTIKSNIPNAFSTDQGIIFVTTGLVSRLTCEAELAFILGHEIAHYTEHHLKQGYLNLEKAKSELGTFNKGNKNDIIKEMSLYSQQHEMYADSLGLLLFSNTEYNLESAIKALEIVDRPSVCFEKRAISLDFYDLDNVKVPRHLFDLNSDLRLDDNNQRDMLNTHPKLELRLRQIESISKGFKKTGQKKFILPEAKFQKVRELARYESIFLNLIERKYVEAIYEIHILEDAQIKNPFLGLAKLKAYYGLIRYKNHNQNRYYNEIILGSEYEDDPCNVLKSFFKGTSKDRLNILALRMAYTTQFEFPLEDDILIYAAEIRKEFALNSDVKLNKLRTDSYSAFLKELELKDTVVDDTIAVNSKFDLKNNNLLTLPESSTEIDLGINKSVEQLEKKKKREEDFHWFYLTDLILEHHLIEDIKAIKNNPSVDMVHVKERKNILIVDPIYQNYKLNSNKRLIKSERTSKKTQEYYTDNYKDIDFEVSMLSHDNLDSSYVAEFNHLSTLKLWFYEISLHEELEMKPSNQLAVDLISDYYNCDHFLFTGIFAYRDRHEFSSLHIAMFGMLWFSPIAIIDLLTVHNNFLQIGILLDSETGKTDFSEIMHVNLKGSKRTIRFYIYNLLKNINSQETL